MLELLCAIAKIKIEDMMLQSTYVFILSKGSSVEYGHRTTPIPSMMTASSVAGQ